MKVNLTVTSELLPRFFRLLEQGFMVTTRSACTIKELLCEQLQIDEEYLDKRIQTLFLNGKAVDNVETAYLQDEATLALSAAMPGLVGATFRKGGAYAAMRNTISYNDAESGKGEGQARAKLKLFNIVLKELGPTFLANGVLIPEERFSAFLSRFLSEIKAGCTTVYLNDKKIDPVQLKDIKPEKAEIFLQVTSEAAS